MGDMSTTHHDIATPGPPQVQELDDGVFAYIQPDGTWWINNTGWWRPESGVNQRAWFPAS
jgi:cyclase